MANAIAPAYTTLASWHAACGCVSDASARAQSASSCSVIWEPKIQRAIVTSVYGDKPATRKHFLAANAIKRARSRAVLAAILATISWPEWNGRYRVRISDSLAGSVKLASMPYTSRTVHVPSRNGLFTCSIKFPSESMTR